MARGRKRLYLLQKDYPIKGVEPSMIVIVGDFQVGPSMF
jgi:hypothetical protein